MHLLDVIEVFLDLLAFSNLDLWRIGGHCYEAYVRDEAAGMQKHRTESTQLIKVCPSVPQPDPETEYFVFFYNFFKKSPRLPHGPLANLGTGLRDLAEKETPKRTRLRECLGPNGFLQPLVQSGWRSLSVESGRIWSQTNARKASGKGVVLVFWKWLDFATHPAFCRSGASPDTWDVFEKLRKSSYFESQLEAGDRGGFEGFGGVWNFWQGYAGHVNREFPEG